jgi:hypothetical protein
VDFLILFLDLFLHFLALSFETINSFFQIRLNYIYILFSKLIIPIAFRIKILNLSLCRCQIHLKGLFVRVLCWLESAEFSYDLSLYKEHILYHLFCINILLIDTIILLFLVTNKTRRHEYWLSYLLVSRSFLLYHVSVFAIQ